MVTDFVLAISIFVYVKKDTKELHALNVLTKFYVHKLKNSYSKIIIDICPYDISWAGKAYEVDTAHALAECSNIGKCDRRTVIAYYTINSSYNNSSVLYF